MHRNRRIDRRRIQPILLRRFRARNENAPRLRGMFRDLSLCGKEPLIKDLWRNRLVLIFGFGFSQGDSCLLRMTLEVLKVEFKDVVAVAVNEGLDDKSKVLR